MDLKRELSAKIVERMEEKTPFRLFVPLVEVQQNGQIVKGKHLNRSDRISKHQDGKLKAKRIKKKKHND